MTQLPPTTSYELAGEEPPGPHTHETEAGVCGAEMSDGSTCERPADECPYPAHKE